MFIEFTLISIHNQRILHSNHLVCIWVLGLERPLVARRRQHQRQLLWERRQLQPFQRERVYGGRTESREPSSGGLNSSSSSLRTCFPPIASKVVPSLGICPFRSNKGCVRYWLYYYYSMHTATLTHEPFKASNVVSGGGYVMKHILACFNLRPTYKSDDGLFTCPIISAILHSAAAWCWLVVSIT